MSFPDCTKPADNLSDVATVASLVSGKSRRQRHCLSQVAERASQQTAIATYYGTRYRQFGRANMADAVARRSGRRSAKFCLARKTAANGV
jgi:hypothetical protein